jgi:quercetin dioxygenase-like cupin family protein
MSTSTKAPAHRGPLPLSFGHAPLSEAVWRKSARSDLEFRDLKLAAGSHGLLNAQHIRATAAGNRTGWFDDTVELLYLHVMAGTLAVQSSEGERIALATGDTLVLPPFGFDPDIFEYDVDFEALEFTSEGSFAFIDEFMARTGVAGAEPETGKLFVDRENPASYITGDGPRSFFTYRDIGATAATGRRMHIHVVGIAAQPPGGTGWHNHSMDQFFMPFTGWIELWVENLGLVRLERGDAMFIPAGLRHNVTAFTLDYTVVEVCIPTEYSTDAQPAPEDMAEEAAA